MWLGVAKAPTPLTGTPLAPGCSFWIKLSEPNVPIPGTISGTTCTYVGSVPAALGYPDFRFVTQWVGLLGQTFDVSNAHEIVFEATDPVARVYNSCTATDPVGTKQAGAADVLRLLF